VMNKKVIFFVLMLFLVTACGSRQVKVVASETTDVQEHASAFHRQTWVNEHNVKRKINFEQHRELLDVFLLLPDSAFGIGGRSWWKIEDRKEWYNEIKANNFWVATDTHFFDQTSLTQNHISFLVIDGFFAIHTYKTIDNSLIVITHQGIGDGNFVHIFEVKNNEITQTLDFEALFGNYLGHIKRSDFSQECNQKLIDVWFEHYFWVFDFRFSDDKVQISCALLIDKETFEDCLNGNSVVYRFNPKTKKFDVEKIYWRSR